jgi:hypothetical protein
MPVVTLEGVVENGQIRLKTDRPLPEKTKVYVVIPEYELAPPLHMMSPRLAHPEQAADFVKQVIEGTGDA